MLDTIYLPKLNNLRPTMDSTLWKAMEEAGELARAVLKFLPYEHLSPQEVADHVCAASLLSDVSEELLDVAQTCVTMIFVMEDFYQVHADALIGAHLTKLQDKGYRYDLSKSYCIATAGNFKSLNLPRLSLEQVTLLTTVCKIQEEIGELTQFLGKQAGASGEANRLSDDEVLAGCAEELLDVAQCCFTMMYILAEQYAVDMEQLMNGHVAKLRRKGYCA
jgi:NTP pyrophosphatase (non-canonical NTP hydrolase)